MQGAFSSAMEEWAEGAIFRTWVSEGRLMRRAEISQLTVEEYLGGLFDFTSELNRLCVAKATERHKAAVKQYLQLSEVLEAPFPIVSIC